MNQLILKKKNELTKKKKGFTLVELIIVIAVIAVLAAVAIPKFGAVKKDANLAADQANAKIIATAVSSAIANGDENVYNASGVVDSAKIIKYIDGNQLPSPKYTDAKGFKIMYTDANGVVVTLNKVAAGTGDAVAIGTSNTTGQVYPVK